MVAKLIVHGLNRALALARMNRALAELCIDGIKTNKDQQQWIINNKIFRSGKFGTSYFGEIAKELEHDFY
jgi:acetyl-CoA carboxylase biotin carboxylase subunit